MKNELIEVKNLNNCPPNTKVRVYYNEEGGRGKSVKKKKSKYTLNQLGERVNQLGETVDKLIVTVATLAKTVEEGFKQVNARIDKLEARVNRIDMRLDYNNLKKLSQNS